MRKLPFLVLLAATLLGCDDDDAKNPEPGKLFTLAVDADYTDLGDGAVRLGNWVLIHDLEGHLVDSKKYVAGDVIEFDRNPSTPSDSFSVTLCKVYEYDQKLFFHAHSYANEKAGERWDLKPLSWTPGQSTPLGDATFNFEHPGNGTSATVSAISNKGYSYTPVNGATNINYTFSLYDEINDFLISSYTPEGVPKYKFLENVQAGTYSYELSDLSDFDEVKTYNIPASMGTLLFVVGSNDGDAYGRGFLTNVFHKIGSETSSLKIGRLNRLTKYQLYLRIGSNEHEYGYSSYGSLPESLAFPVSLQVVISNSDFDHFTFSTNEKYLRSNILWYQETGDFRATWEVFEDGTGFTNPHELPTEILELIPKFDMNALESTPLSIYTTTRSQEDFLAEKFKGQALPSEFTEVYKTF
jgi:hypothetical protein